LDKESAINPLAFNDGECGEFWSTRQFISPFDTEKHRCEMFVQDESILYLLLKLEKI
jgi:hypothetical protein